LEKESKTMELHRESRIRRIEDVMTAEVDNEMVMMRLESNGYFGLDEIGRRVWELLAEPRSVAELCDLLCEEYDVSPAECERDTLLFLGELDSHGLLQA
jgi:hypothetical protein